MIITKIQQLSMLQIENVRIPFSDEEERLLATIPSHVNKMKLDFFVKKFFVLDNSEFIR
jgi:hypothetical protein